MRTFLDVLIVLVLLGTLVASVNMRMQFLAAFTLVIIFFTIILTYIGRTKK